jgi:hypothetical protein
LPRSIIVDLSFAERAAAVRRAFDLPPGEVADGGDRGMVDRNRHMAWQFSGLGAVGPHSIATSCSGAARFAQFG